MAVHEITLYHSMIILGEKVPDVNIDVFLQPLIKELSKLWEGVDAFDHLLRHILNCGKLFIRLLMTFPHMLIYLEGVQRVVSLVLVVQNGHKLLSVWLENGHKFCYIGHRCCLPKDHPFNMMLMDLMGTLQKKEGFTNRRLVA